MSKLKQVLLIDDDIPTNFINKMTLEDIDCAEHIQVCQTGNAALEFLTTEKEGGYPRPELIFLDINMPGMNGWEFIEEYKKLPDNQKGDIIIIMLTTSINPQDEENARKSGIVNDFKNKPLTRDLLTGILNDYFPKIAQH